MAQSGSVFHLFHSAGVGGIEIHLLQLAAAQREQGWTPRILTQPRGWLAEQAFDAGFEVLPLPMRGFFDPLSALRLGRLIRRHRPDLLHAHAMRASHYARLARRWNQAPALVMTAHSTNSWKHFDRAAPIICVSRAVERVLCARGLSNLHLIYHGIPEIPPQPAESVEESPLFRGLAERKRTQDRLVLLQVGRFIRDKGQDWLLEELADLPRELAERVLVLFAGDWRGTDYGRACRHRLASSPRLREIAVLIGQTSMEALSAWYRLADVLVLPSRREALSLSLLEAARAGLPALASAVGGIPELVRDAENGYLFPCEDSAAFRAQLQHLLDPAQRHALGTAARTRFLEHFTTERMANQTLALYHRVLDGDASSPARS
ncbi:glycosyltransferase family 4 protein [Candidatus Thiosymbion oneisti]|uniref:glycosyltransferase family 4 protein n=1 Tax=Candidatus Thiosymbion oneisti TaxID=589554 RepID=UPI000A79284B|nr:glycosyltransferase family 4 protein [Candidatus Thiosymbion oneisti]